MAVVVTYLTTVTQELPYCLHSIFLAPKKILSPYTKARRGNYESLGKHLNPFSAGLFLPYIIAELNFTQIISGFHPVSIWWATPIKK
jgi:hypothetical protein